MRSEGSAAAPPLATIATHAEDLEDGSKMVQILTRRVGRGQEGELGMLLVASAEPKLNVAVHHSFRRGGSHCAGKVGRARERGCRSLGSSSSSSLLPGGTPFVGEEGRAVGARGPPNSKNVTAITLLGDEILSYRRREGVSASPRKSGRLSLVCRSRSSKRRAHLGRQATRS